MHVLMEWGDDYHGSRPVMANPDKGKVQARMDRLEADASCGSCKDCDFQYWYSIVEVENGNDVPDDRTPEEIIESPYKAPTTRPAQTTELYDEPPWIIICVLIGLVPILLGVLFLLGQD